MVYKKFIKRNGKDVGPYYYTSIREDNGNVKTIYLGKVGYNEALRKEGMLFNKLKGTPIPDIPVQSETPRNTAEPVINFKLFAFIVVAISMSLFISGGGFNWVSGLFVVENLDENLPTTEIKVTAQAISPSVTENNGKLMITELELEGYSKSFYVKDSLNRGRFSDIGYGELYYCSDFDISSETCSREWIFIKNLAGFYHHTLKDGAYGIKDKLF